MATKHTPGPWKDQGSPNDACCHQCGVCDSAGEHIADVADKRDLELIIAAPETATQRDALLAACKMTVDQWDDVRRPGAACEDCPDPDYVTSCRAAIAQAEGG